jgi:hypothetical protein
MTIQRWEPQDGARDAGTSPGQQSPTVPLWYNGQVVARAKVSPEDHTIVSRFKWSLAGYTTRVGQRVVTSVFRRQLKLHQLVMLHARTGSWLEDQLEHIFGLSWRETERYLRTQDIVQDPEVLWQTLRSFGRVFLRYPNVLHARRSDILGLEPRDSPSDSPRDSPSDVSRHQTQLHPPPTTDVPTNEPTELERLNKRTVEDVLGFLKGE